MCWITEPLFFLSDEMRIHTHLNGLCVFIISHFYIDKEPEMTFCQWFIQKNMFSYFTIDMKTERVYFASDSFKSTCVFSHSLCRHVSDACDCDRCWRQHDAQWPRALQDPEPESTHPHSQHVYHQRSYRRDQHHRSRPGQRGAQLFFYTNSYSEAILMGKACMLGSMIFQSSTQDKSGSNTLQGDKLVVIQAELEFKIIQKEHNS